MSVQGCGAISFSAFHLALILKKEAGFCVDAHDKYQEKRVAYFKALIALLSGKRPLWRLADMIPRVVHFGILEKLIPGFRKHVFTRKALVGRVVYDHATRHPAGQTIILSGGFDDAVCRFAELFPQHRFVETDQEEMVRLKRQALERAGIAVPGNVSFFSLDFTMDSLKRYIQEKGLVHPALPVLYVLEGVAMYLTEAQASALILALAEAVDHEAVLLFGALAPSRQKQKDAGTWLAQAVLGFYREHYRWRQLPETMREWLADKKWRMDRIFPFGGAESALETNSGLVRECAPDREHYYLCSLER